jgi:hypothetical protein
MVKADNNVDASGLNEAIEPADQHIDGKADTCTEVEASNPAKDQTSSDKTADNGAVVDQVTERDDDTKQTAAQAADGIKYEYVVAGT